MPHTYSSLEKIRAELPWVNETPELILASSHRVRRKAFVSYINDAIELGIWSD